MGGGSLTRELELLEHARAARRQGPRNMRWRWGLVGLAAMVALMASFAAAVYRRTGWVAGLATGPLLAAAGPDGRLVVAVVGIDERSHDPGRTDVILVGSLDVRRRRVGVLSVPRDTRVRVPGGGFNKVNMVYSAAGYRGLMQTLSELLGVEIDGYVKVNFRAFIGLIDALGGVDLDVEHSMRYVDRAQGLYIDIPAGHQHLNGKQALDYVRYRADGLGDISYDPGQGQYYGRIERQQKFLRALVDAMLRPSSVWALPRIARQAYALVETDLSMDTVLAAAAWAADRKPISLRTEVLPGYPGQIGQASYWLPDLARGRRLAREILGAGMRPQVSVTVLNANGVSGSAARVARYLQGHGLNVAAVGNAHSFSRSQTWVVATDESSRATALEVARLLGLQPERVRVADGGEAGAPADVVVWVGQDLARLR